MLDETRPTEFAARVHWAGEIDIATVGSFGAAIDKAAAGGGDLCIDLRDTTFIDSTGIGALIRAATAASERGSAVTVLAEQPMMRRVFRLMNLDAVVAFETPLAEFH